VKFFYRNPSF